jgi:hypothetical protein
LYLLSSCFLLFLIEKIKRTFQVNIAGWDDVKVDGRGVDGCMAEKLTYGVEIISLVQKVGGKTMPEGMEAALLGYASFFFALDITDHAAVLEIWR